jgi:ATP-binding cassette, subfamily F, member 3
MLHLKNISLSYGGQVLFRDVNWHLRPQDRVALVGPNGAGKSTLMKVIAGLVLPDKGEVSALKGSTFGYLPQEGIVARGRSLFAEVKSAFDELLAMRDEMEAIERALETAVTDESERLLVRYGHLQDQFSARGGYAMDATVGAVLGGLGFEPEQWESPCEAFSGGWQMRIALARLLVQSPSVLLLDEPTNHLDIEARNWLEDYLKSYPGSLVLVSHDRYFLDVTVKRVTELAQCRLHDYHTNYSGMELERERRWSAIQEAYERQREEIEQIERFISRFRAQATKASQVQSRVKMLEKLERIEPPPGRTKKIQFRLPEAPRSGQQALKATDLAKSYGAKTVLRNVELQLLRGEKVALVGHNGAGKTTLIKMLAGAIDKDAGHVALGHNVEMLYFAQDQNQTLDAEKTVLEEVTSAAPYQIIPRLRGILGGFLFSGENVDKPISVLSGGERNRVALAKLLLQPSNLLLLDEPTNHLDLASKDVLLEALQRYQGTVLFVSHDRYFVDKLAQKVFEVEATRVTEYLGNYEDYLSKKAAQEAAALARDQGIRYSTAGPAAAPPAPLEGKASGAAHKPAAQKPAASAGGQPPAPKPAVKPAPVHKEARKAEHQKRRDEGREQQRERRRLETRRESVQKQIEEREQEVGELEELMASPGFFDDFEKGRETTARHQEVMWQVKTLYDEWERLEARIAALAGSA